MRQIKASEVKPGMTVKWKRGKFTHEVPVERVHSTAGGRTTWFVNGVDGMSVQSDTPVTVLSEPQPEEPTWAGAKVLAGVHRFLRCGQGVKPWRRVLSNGAVGNLAWSWSDVCSRGLVTVVPDQGWTVPGDAPEVPERIEEWPEEDDHLRGHEWRDRDGAIWSFRCGQWGYESISGGWASPSLLRYPFDGPWTRKDD